MLEEIDNNDLSQVEKVERYIELIKSFRRINKTVTQQGEMVVTENASQRFVKAHPLIGERNKLNSQLLALGKEIDKHIEEERVKQEKEKRYNSADLI